MISYKRAPNTGLPHVLAIDGSNGISVSPEWESLYNHPIHIYVDPKHDFYVDYELANSELNGEV